MIESLLSNPWILVGLKVLAAFMMVGAVMTMAGYSVLAERKVSAWMQGRVGPNRTVLPIIGSIPLIGPLLRGLGIFQPLADGLKFLFKEEIVPGHVNKFYYYLAPLVALVPALTTMTVLPFGQMYWPDGSSSVLALADLEIGILFVFAVSSLGVYGIVLAGWSSNSKYPFLGGIRSSAQMISYELAMGLSCFRFFSGLQCLEVQFLVSVFPRLPILRKVPRGFCWCSPYPPLSF